ncbi:MAG: PEP-CTERM sorting domain-containing protein [Leptolyngbya sp. PLA2]|nr:PEP-CTERM sorting domain-containing protein [Leptolyngbya sp.]MCE7972553.1 PEP-CTERM sorting domain-containing protein [Leptolyngbya sp. PL-A2]MCZ7632539.1 PEP-CTERM sorting domain-containing protein [Phycisphaerales bacterium]MDL1905003.1 PEP-CTERM sorting domain-containing protein [Synechococcales cyanobacterium CNB]GIK19903.1 MAG: hypothetical protein BroJett004_20670 [Planctomycetota bacterium]
MNVRIEAEPRLVRVLVAGGLCLALAAPALADISNPPLIFKATSSLGEATYKVSLEDGEWVSEDAWFWMLPSAIDFVDPNNGSLIARLVQGSSYIEHDPVLSGGFSVQAGAVDTTFTITIGSLGFPTISNPFARASAGMTVTDGDGNGASVKGLMPGGTMYHTSYNFGTAFASLISGPLVEPDAWGTNSDSDEYPAGAGNFIALGGPASEMFAEWKFTLTANDSAAGTGVFVVIPAPGVLALVGTGLGFVATRRRR